ASPAALAASGTPRWFWKCCAGQAKAKSCSWSFTCACLARARRAPRQLLPSSCARRSIELPPAPQSGWPRVCCGERSAPERPWGH
ncbi:unnamed protein product, partial [Effrenium voratum]